MSPPWPEAARAAPADFALCRTRIRGGSRSFFAASLLLPPAVSEPAFAVYAFCRSADDLIDSGAPHDGLALLRSRLARVYEGRPVNDAVDRAFAHVVAQFGIPRAVPEALLEGFAWDAAGRRYATLVELEAYSARVAGTVGAMMTLLMGIRDPEVLARACELGVAMQLTNIARDVGEDARAGRVYLPTEWLREAGIDVERWLAAPRFNPEIASVTRRLLREADVLYLRAAAGIARLPLVCRPGILAARLLYAEIGRELERRGHDSVNARTVVPLSRKLTLLGRSIFGPSQHPPAAGVAHDAVAPLGAIRFLVEAVLAQGPVVVQPPAMADDLDRFIVLLERLERRDRGLPRRDAESAAH